MRQTSRLEGIFPVLATPLRKNEEVDEQGLRRLIRHILHADNSGLVICGSIGEFAALSYEERQKAIQIAVDEVRGRVPVIAGTGDSGTKKAVKNTKVAEEVGANYALVTLPFYYRSDPQGMIEHYQAILSGTSIPLIIYNIPMFTHVPVSIEAIQKLAEHERIAGIKDAGGDFTYFENVIHHLWDRKNFSVMQGWDSLLFAAFVYGAHGAVVWASNVLPDLPVALYKAVRNGRLEEARSIQGVLLRLGKIMERRKSLHASLKATLSLMGICEPTVSKSISSLTSGEIAELQNDLKEFGLL